MIFRTYLPHNEVEIRYPNSCDIYKHYIFEYCLAQVILDNVDVSCSEDWNVYRPNLKSQTTTMFFFQKKISFMHFYASKQSHLISTWHVMGYSSSKCYLNTRIKMNR